MAAHSVGFFGIKLVPGDVHRMDVTRDFRLTNVTFADDVKAGTKVIVKVHYAMLPEIDYDSEDEEAPEPIEDPEELAYSICTLVAGKNDQATIDLQFVEEEEVGFSIVGNAPVDLVGNYIAPPDFYDQDPDSDEFDSDSEDDSEVYGDLDMEEMDDDEEDDEERFEEVEETPKKAIEAPASNNKKRAAEEVASPATAAAKLTKNQEKRANKKAKTDNETPAASPARKDKAAEKPAEEKKAAASSDKMTKTKLPSGLLIEEKKTGTGPMAKPGQRVGMRYVGKLQNGKVFDQCVKGKPFVFKLGKGEVIKAWDEGVKGMQVGTERRLTCPPKLAYGNQKIPGIPPNSTLVFDVKLVEIK